MRKKETPNYYYIPCKPNTKEAKYTGWQKVTCNQMVEWGKENVGAVLQNNSLVIDIDTKNNPNAFEIAKQFCKDIGIEYKLNVQTPSGGAHIYLEKDPDIEITSKYLPQYGRGLEFKYKGTYVCFPPSVIDGKEYKYLELAEAFRVLTKEQNEKLRKLFEVKKNREVYKKALENKEYAQDISIEDIKRLLGNIDPDCDYDTWFKVMMALHNHFKGGYEGFALWEAWSSLGSKFSENKFGEMENKYNTYAPTNVAENVTIGTLIYLANQNNGFGSKKESTVQEDIEKATWLNDWVYYPHGQSGYYNIHTLEKHNTTSFNDINKHLIPPIRLKNGDERRLSPTLYIDRNINLKRIIVQGFEYNPTTNDKIFINKIGHKTLNLFRRESIPAPATEYTKEGELAISYFYDHLFLFGKKDGSILLYYLAHIMQRIGVRMNWFILLGSTLQGVGKSFLLDLVQKMLGYENSKIPRLADFLSQYNEWADARLFLGVHEFYAVGNKKEEIMNELKSIITDQRTPIRRIYEANTMIDLHCNGIFCTNYIESLSEEDQRRIYPISLEATTKEELDEMRGFDDSELTKRVGLILKHSDQIAKYLLEVKIPEDFNKDKRAPGSVLRETLKQIAKDSIVGLREAEYLIQRQDEYFNKDYIVMARLWLDIEEQLTIGEKANKLNNFHKNKIRRELGYYGSTGQFRINAKRQVAYFKKKYTPVEMLEIVKSYQGGESYEGGDDDK